MAINSWSVLTPADPALGPNTPIPVGAKVVSSLSAALHGTPLKDWSFEVRGEPVENFDEFQRLLNEAEGIGYADFVARANGTVVESN